MDNRALGHQERGRALRRGRALIVPAAALALAAAACVHRQPPVAAVETSGAAAIDMKASDYKFTPNNIRAKVGETLQLRIENVSDKTHNFTIKNPKGQILKSVGLPAHQTVIVPVELPSDGTYHFYCDISIHATLGMKGWVTVTK